MKNLFFLFVIFLICSSNIFAEWEFVNYQPETTDFYAVDILNPSVAIVAGNSGTVRKTTDGGNSWSIVIVNSNPNLKEIIFLNDTVLITVGESGKIFRSSDGGMNWNEVNSGTDENLNSIFKLNSTTAYITGENGVILKTEDAGVVWQQITSMTDKNLHDLYCNSDGLVLVVGDEGTILRSENYGTSWQQITIESKANIQLVRSMNNSTFFATGDSLTVLKSIDSGLTWNKLVVDSNYANKYTRPKIIGGYFGMDSLIMFYIYDRMSFSPLAYNYISSDCGKSWKSRNISNDFYPLNPTKFKFLNDINGYIVGLNGEIDKVIVGYDKLEISSLVIYSSTFGRKIDAVDRSYIAMIHTHGSPIHCILSTDAGDFWFHTSTFDTIGRASRGLSSFKDLAYTSKNNLLILMNNEKKFIINENQYIVKYYGFLLRSTDLGQSWTEFIFPDSLMGQGISMYNNEQGVLLASNFRYFRTNNGGETWEKMIAPDTSINYVDEVICTGINEYVLIAAFKDRSRKIYITKDGGMTWDSSWSLPFNFFNFTKLTDSKAICSSSIYDSVAKRKTDLIKYTDDAGITWQDALPDDGYNMQGIRKFIFNDDKNGIAISADLNYSYNKLYYYYTKTGGKSWKRDSVGFFGISETIYDGVYIEPGLAYLYGNMGTLVRSDGTIINVEEIVKNTNPEIGIFPNPISNYFNIYFYLTEDNTIDISIYDMAGKLVHEPVKSVWYGMGGHNLNIECSGFIPGAYFAVLKYKGKAVSSKFIIRR